MTGRRPDYRARTRDAIMDMYGYTFERRDVYVSRSQREGVILNFLRGHLGDLTMNEPMFAGEIADAMQGVIEALEEIARREDAL